MPSQSIYTVGGTVQAGGGVYIKRKADDDLLELCRGGELGFILSSRQVGKSSLMTRTAEQLAHENIRSSMIDLSSLGTQITVNEWYLGILNIIATDLNLATDIFTWWAQYQGLGPAQRFFNFLRDVVLKEVGECVVLFFDEIDTTLSLDFADDFFTTLRAIYNARSNTPDFRRLSFVLVGVATPGDLISDSKRTPFNIGRRVEIKDFMLAEALPLAQGLGEQAVQVLTWIFQYTNGHPYLTQRLCAYLAGSPGPISEQDVDRAVERLFTGEQGKQDNNLQFVRDMLSKRSPDVTKVLLLYEDVRAGKSVADDERSIAKAHLKLSGLVRSEKGTLRVRNEIYNSVFNAQWIEENTPKNWQKAALIALSTILGILLLGTLIIFINDYVVGSIIDDQFRSFYSASTPKEKLHSLAEIYKRSGILTNKDSQLAASQLFYNLPEKEDQLAIFKIDDPGFYGLSNSEEDIKNAKTRSEDPNLQNDLVIVIDNLYITAANVNQEDNNTELLEAMRAALEIIQENQKASEIEIWVTSRASVTEQGYETAWNYYSTAVAASNYQNPATLYERAKVYLALSRYTDALADLDKTMKYAKESAFEAPTPTPTLTPKPSIPGSAIPIFTSLTPILEPSMTATFYLPTATLYNNETLVGTPSFSVGTLMPPLMTTPACAQIPAPTCPPCDTSSEKFESNFITIWDIVYAVKALFDNAPQLNDVAVQEDVNAYSNLKEFNLILTHTPTSTITSTPATKSLTTPPPAQTSVSQIFCILAIENVVGVNVRSGPDVSYAPFDEQVKVGTCLTFDAMNEDGTWLQISQDQMDPELQKFAGGWIRRDLLELESTNSINLPAVTLTPTPPPSSTPSKAVSTQPSPTLGIGSTMMSVEDGMTVLYVPEGDFSMGGTIGDEKPIHTVLLSAFWIDRTEVTNAMYAKCVADQGCEKPGNLDRYNNSQYSNHPVTNVTWEMANAYCTWAGRRLPTEAEWEKAAAGNADKKQEPVYPWGNEIDCSKANYQGKTGNIYCIGNTAEVATYPDGVGPYGVLDMAGNVWEWVSDWYNIDYYNLKISWSDPLGPEAGRERVIRGGGWNTTDTEVRSTNRGKLNPNSSSNSIGFRCALTP